MRFGTWRDLDSPVQLMDSEADRKEAIRHLRHKLVEIWCNRPLNDYEAHQQRSLILEKIRRIRG